MKKYLILWTFSLMASTSLFGNPTVGTSFVPLGGGQYQFFIQISNQGSYTLSNVEWDFGDGTVYINTNSTMTHQFSQNDHYAIYITCTYASQSGPPYSSYSYIAMSVNDVPRPCPKPFFVTPRWCGQTMLTGLAYCPLLYGVNNVPYWQVDSVLWNYGDGNIETTYGISSHVNHAYTQPLTVTLTAVAYFTGLNGEYCAVPIRHSSLVYFHMSGSDPCDIVNDPLVIFQDSYTFNPNFIHADLTMSPNPSYSNTLIDIIPNITFYPTSIGSNPWQYTLFVDGIAVASGSGLPSTSIYQDYFNTGQHTLELTITDVLHDIPCEKTSYTVIEVLDSIFNEPCNDCNTFKPFPGERYWLSAWVKEGHSSPVKTYTSPIELGFTGSGQANVTFTPSGEIIDGWQRIVGSFTIPSNTTDLEIELLNNLSSEDIFFDDIRIHPFKASMKSYVYDPETLWLSAELDDNNYATFYEYDLEGQLIRIKKETARGIMTIQESRSANPKKDH